MAAIATWTAIGGGIGLIAATLLPTRFPAGLAGATAAGAAGAFVGGGMTTLLSGHRSGGVDIATLAAAAALALLVLLAARYAELAEPRPR